MLPGFPGSLPAVASKTGELKFLCEKGRFLASTCPTFMDVVPGRDPFAVLNNDCVALILWFARATDCRFVCRRFYRVALERAICRDSRRLLVHDYVVNVSQGTVYHVGNLAPTRSAFSGLHAYVSEAADPMCVYASLLQHDGQRACWLTAARTLHLVELTGPWPRLVATASLADFPRGSRGDCSLVLGHATIVCWTTEGLVAVYDARVLLLPAVSCSHVLT